mgnify:CR=1 FL=1
MGYGLGFEIRIVFHSPDLMKLCVPDGSPERSEGIIVFKTFILILIFTFFFFFLLDVLILIIFPKLFSLFVVGSVFRDQLRQFFANDSPNIHLVFHLHLICVDVIGEQPFQVFRHTESGVVCSFLYGLQLAVDGIGKAGNCQMKIKKPLRPVAAKAF